MALGLSIIALLLLRPIPKPKNRRKIVQLRAWTEVPFAFFSIAIFLAFLAFWIPFVYVPTYAIYVLQADSSTAFYALCVLNAGSFFGRIIPALAAQRFGPMLVFLGATAGCSMLLFSWIAVYNLPGYFAFCAIFGFFSGVLVSVPPASLTHPILSPSLDVVGTRLGMSWSMAGMGVLVGSPVAGKLIQQGGATSFFSAQVFTGCCMAVSAIVLAVPCTAVMRHDKRRRLSGTTIEHTQDVEVASSLNAAASTVEVKDSSSIPTDSTTAVDATEESAYPGRKTHESTATKTTEIIASTSTASDVNTSEKTN
jgi:predicted MFS family arabinose efflux permease